MSQNTFPAFTDMIPTVEDIQLIVDSLRQEDRSRTTKDGIFTPGIVNQKDSYLQIGSAIDGNSLKIKPFIAYTANGDRIEVSSTWDNLYAQGNVIKVTDANLVSEYINIPVWYPYTISYSNLTAEALTESLKLIELGKGSVLHGIKVRATVPFTDASESNIFISIGTQSEPEKFLPPTLISQQSEDISVMNLMYSLSDTNTTPIMVTFTSDSGNLSVLTNGTLSINLCVANLSGFDNSEVSYTDGGFALSNTATGTWQPSTTYHIVVRYEETKSNYRQLNYDTIDGTNITTVSEPTRFTTSYGFYALRKTGSVIDYTTVDDVKLGEIITDTLGNISRVFVNGKNSAGDDYTQYLTIPGYRFVDGINADQIGEGTVTNKQFGYLSNLDSDVQNQLNSKASVTIDNTFKGKNTFEQQIDGSIEKVNGFTAYSTPAPNALLVLDENGKIPASAISESTFSSIGNFYTVSSGVTTYGRSSFLTPNNTLNGVNVVADDSNPLVINYASGAVEKITETKNVTGLIADGYYYLIKEKNGNFSFLPTSGGTMACIPVITNGTTFPGEATSKIASSYSSNVGVNNAFDGSILTGVNMGKVTYKNVDDEETIGYLPAADSTLSVQFPSGTAYIPTAFALCMRLNDDDVAPKAITLQGTNVTIDSAQDTDWTDIYKNVITTQGSTTTGQLEWNKGEIKTIEIPAGLVTPFRCFRLVIELNDDTIWNYQAGEETPATGITMPLNCYYFQLYATNTDTSIKGNVVEGYVQPSGMSMGSYFLDISKKPYTGYKCVGNNTFAPIDYVKLGFVNMTGYNTDHTVITCYPFCYNTFTISDETNVALNSDIIFNHNLGVIPNVINVKFKCLADNNGYSAGDVVDNIYMNDVTGITSVKDTLETTVTSIKLHPGVSGKNLYVKNKSTGVLGIIDNTGSIKWAAIIYCSRGW